jgi:hypothetical protein
MFFAGQDEDLTLFVPHWLISQIGDDVGFAQWSFTKAKFAGCWLSVHDSHLHRPSRRPELKMTRTDIIEFAPVRMDGLLARLRLSISFPSYDQKLWMTATGSSGFPHSVHELNPGDYFAQ